MAAVWPAAMATVAGATVTLAGVPLVRVTTTPPVGAGAPSVMVPFKVDPMPMSSLCTANVIGGGVMWGRITEKVSGLTKRADSHRAELQSHDVRLNTHDVAIGRLEEWKAGYNAAVHAGGRSTEA